MSGKTPPTTDEGAPPWRPSTLLEAFAFLQSKIGSLLHIESKMRRWGLDSREPRPEHPHHAKTNLALLVEEFSQVQAASRHVEHFLIAEIVWGMPRDQAPGALRLSGRFGGPVGAAQTVALKRGVGKLVELIRKHQNGAMKTARLADLPPSTWPHFIADCESACREQRLSAARPKVAPRADEDDLI